MTEKELIERSRGGEHEAFAELYNQHVDRVYRLTYRMAGDEDLARDFTQEDRQGCPNPPPVYVPGTLCEFLTLYECE